MGGQIVGRIGFVSSWSVQKLQIIWKQITYIPCIQVRHLYKGAGGREGSDDMGDGGGGGGGG